MNEAEFMLLVALVLVVALGVVAWQELVPRWRRRRAVRRQLDLIRRESEDWRRRRQFTEPQIDAYYASERRGPLP